MQDLFSLFKELSKPEQEVLQSFTVVHLEGTSHRVGKDAAGWPVLLLDTRNTSSTHNSPQIHLEHLEVQHSMRCRVTTNKKTEEGTFTVIRCTDADTELAEYFFRSVDPILRNLGATPSTPEVIRAINHLVELFRALAQPPIKSISGLWAELFVIRNAKNPTALLGAWHTTPEEKFDFNSNIQRLEIKSTSQRDRMHHFSLEQVSPPSGCRVMVVSLFVERSGGGKSLSDLVQEIKLSLLDSPELEEKLDRVVAQTLGNSLRQSMNNRFDFELA